MSPTTYADRIRHALAKLTEGGELRVEVSQLRAQMDRDVSAKLMPSLGRNPGMYVKRALRGEAKRSRIAFTDESELTFVVTQFGRESLPAANTLDTAKVCAAINSAMDAFEPVAKVLGHSFLPKNLTITDKIQLFAERLHELSPALVDIIKDDIRGRQALGIIKACVDIGFHDSNAMKNIPQSHPAALGVMRLIDDAHSIVSENERLRDLLIEYAPERLELMEELHKLRPKN